jgi:hypothetical protein
MNIKGMVEKYLIDNGYDGLCYPEGECDCPTSGLFPCESIPFDCVPGHKVMTGDGYWIIIPGKRSK